MNTRQLQLRLLTVGSVILFLMTGSARAAAPPPNAPATVEWNAGTGKLQLRYHDAVILDATISGEGEIKLEPAETTGEKVEQRLKFDLTRTPNPPHLDPLPQTTGERRLPSPRLRGEGPGEGLVLRGTVTGSGEAFPAETGGEAQKRFPMVRNSVGLSRNLRNHAVYDRRWDWVLVGLGDGLTRIEPQTDEGGKRTFSFESRGESIELIFRPRYYQRHKGLEQFTPWSYRVWPGSLTGYCTWWAYRHSFTQETLDAMLKVFVEKHLPDFGYDYMQFDDTYQQGNGSCPENFLNWNNKFPGGWQYAIKVIRDAGMKPGIWVHRVHRPTDPHVQEIAKAHPDWFVRKSDGSLFMTHGFYALDTTNKEAVDNMVRKLYRGLKPQGWDYVKIDGTGDLLNAYRNKDCAEFFKTHATTPEQSLRTWDSVAREELGPEVYILACHTVGNAQHVIGLVDGARLSNDGFQLEKLAQFSSYEGVVWRNDPDHCDIMGTWLTDENAMMPVFGTAAPVSVRTIVRPAICSLAGGVLMVSDKAEVYEDDSNLEGMKRSAPVLSTVPGQLYDPGHGAAGWWLQEIDRAFDHWSVLARVQWAKKREKEWKFDLKGVPAQEVKFADIGLADEHEYLVFEFWTQKFLGKFKGSFVAPAMDTNNGMDIFAIRETRPHPWILSTTRHLSQGGVDLLDERWDAGRKVLSGKSAVVVDDPYVMTVSLPQGFRLQSAEISGEKVEIANQPETATARFVPSATKTVEWKMTFAK